jgi:DNA polymerase-1
MTVFFDIETNGLLEDMTRIVCVSVSLNGNEPATYHGANIDNALELLSKATRLVGHNIIGFDLPAIRRIRPGFTVSGQIRDTLVMSRIGFSDLRDTDLGGHHTGAAATRAVPERLVGSHSLRAWGHRLGMHKGEFLGSVDELKDLQFSPRLAEYCEQDVRITVRLFSILWERLSTTCIDLEHEFATIIDQQNRNGFAFDTSAAASLYAELAQRRDELTEELQKIVPPTEVHLKTKVKVIPFNPQSRQQIAAALVTHCGWRPTEHTPSGEVKVDETELSKIDHPMAQSLVEYLTLSKRIGMLYTGTEAWMKNERNGRIYGFTNHNGAVTGRCTHRTPNMAQVPSSGSPYGKGCRSLFVAPPGRTLVGVDASGLELRCLAHYMARYDDGEYSREVDQGDIHTKNQRAAGLDTRDQAKSFIYAFLYGAGPAKLGSVIGGGFQEGRKLQRRFLDSLPALKQLKHDILAAVSSRKSLIGLDGRVLPIRSPHAALNTLLQSAGAVIMKKATCLMNRKLQDAGIDYLQVGHIHDEVQFEVEESRAPEAAALVSQAIPEAGEFFGFRCPLRAASRTGRSWAETH